MTKPSLTQRIDEKRARAMQLVASMHHNLFTAGTGHRESVAYIDWLCELLVIFTELQDLYITESDGSLEELGRVVDEVLKKRGRQ